MYTTDDVVEKKSTEHYCKPVPDYRFRVLSGHQSMGELISRWSRDPNSRPDNLDALKAQAQAAGIVLEIGRDISELQFYAMHNDHRAVIYLPPPDLIDADLPDGKYPLPSFYRDAFPYDDQIDDKDAFKMSRIGEYTTQKCY